MVIKKKGQAIMYGAMISLMLFLVVVAVLPVFKDTLTDVRAPNTATSYGMDCGNTSISTGEKGACIIVDWSLQYWAGIMLALAAIYLTGKKLDVF